MTQQIDFKLLFTLLLLLTLRRLNFRLTSLLYKALFFFQKEKKHEDLRLNLLEKILYDAIHVRLGVKTNRQKTTRNKSELV